MLGLEFDELKLDKMQPAVPTAEDMGFLLKWTAAKNPVHYVLLRLFYASGLRLSEMAQLRFGDILWDSQCLFVRCGKGNKDRYVLVDEATLEEVRGLEGSQDPQRFIFPWSPSSLRRFVHDCAVGSGLYQKYLAWDRGLSTHSLRHAFATHSYENGLDFSIVSHLLGHDHHDTTAIYLHTANRQAESDYARSDPDGIRELPRRCLAPAARMEWSQSEEIQVEFSSQMLLLSGAFQLPAVPTPGEVRRLREASGDDLILAVLYSTGMFLEECLKLQPEHLRDAHIQLGPRRIQVVPAVLARLRASGCGFGVSVPDYEQRLLDFAAQTGLRQRFEALGRKFSSHSLRSAFACHRLNAGMREITLMDQLGLQYFVCVATYLATASARWLPRYLECHELERRPELFNP